MSTQHTPGPWSVDLGTATATVRSEHKGVSIARCYQGDEDARLIAAAPELLAALERLIKSSLAVSDLRHNDHPIDDEDWSSLYNDVMDARSAIAKATTNS